MDWNSLFHSKYLRGGLCAVLIAAILLGLWLPGTGLKEAQPDDPLQGEGVREITVLKLGENLEQLNTISVPSGGQKKSTARPDRKKHSQIPLRMMVATVRRTETRGRTAGKFLPRSCRWS